MPTYDYRCEKCGHQFSVTTSIKSHEEAKTECPKCKSGKVKPKIQRFFAKTRRKS